MITPCSENIEVVIFMVERMLRKVTKTRRTTTKRRKKNRNRILREFPKDSFRTPFGSSGDPVFVEFPEWIGDFFAFIAIILL
jgi:hypothetical protein